ncbi:MarR family transcriptional regulator [Aliidongia dinghuensis]|uniref:MarR family transcriptional regulator n=1 Tax=Aliidongia dinghuensis TaxID=1867774 RepID=A0A8J3E3I3_9PROT|nr:MarR family transcriptional regulator [Aliidongia dinghuensis]GGF18846.1 MarR family transcriptional regulator [Aliidongia dinghuensis]
MNEQSNGAGTDRAPALASELRVLVGRLKRRLREQASLGDLTGSQAAVIRHLESHGPATVTALARAEGVRPQSMGATVAVLEAAGLVDGAPDPQDRRQTILSLTAACQERIKLGRAAREDWLGREIRTKLTPGEQDELAQALRLLQRLVAR